MAKDIEQQITFQQLTPHKEKEPEFCRVPGKPIISALEPTAPTESKLRIPPAILLAILVLGLETGLLLGLAANPQFSVQQPIENSSSTPIRSRQL